LRTYALLDESGVFENKRGIGFFVSEHAVEIIRATEKKVFILSSPFLYLSM
jgi:DNA-binding transcriptional regulator YhcF (GntR family)